MIAELSEEEWTVLSHIHEQALIDAAADLDLVLPDAIKARELLEAMIPAIIDRGRTEGLPFSKYERDDLEALSFDARRSISALQGLSPTDSVDAILKAGHKVYKRYLRVRPNNPVALLLPTLLPVIARVAAHSD